MITNYQQTATKLVKQIENSSAYSITYTCEDIALQCSICFENFHVIWIRKIECIQQTSINYQFTAISLDFAISLCAGEYIEFLACCSWNWLSMLWGFGEDEKKTKKLSHCSCNMILSRFLIYTCYFKWALLVR